jgi:hypothetical protein
MLQAGMAALDADQRRQAERAAARQQPVAPAAPVAPPAA